MIITSLTNQKLKEWIKLKEVKYRKKYRKFLIEGDHLVEEAYQKKCLEAIVVLEGYEYPQFQNIQTYYVSKEIMRRLNAVSSQTFIIGVCNMLEQNLLSNENIIMLDGVQDPGNLGTILRNAYSFGYKNIVLSNECVDLYNDKVIRSTQGAFFHLSILRCDIIKYLEKLKNEGYHIYATALTNAIYLQKIEKKTPYVLVFGNEGKGVCQKVLEKSDTIVKIEMEAFESLNVGVAAGICMYQLQYCK